MKNNYLPWYLQSWAIALCFTFSFLIAPLIIGLILLNKQKKVLSELLNDPRLAIDLEELRQNYNDEEVKLKSEFETLSSELQSKITQLQSDFDNESASIEKRIKASAEEFERNKNNYQQKINGLQKVYNEKQKKLEEQIHNNISGLVNRHSELQGLYDELEATYDAKEKELQNQLTRKSARLLSMLEETEKDYAAKSEEIKKNYIEFEEEALLQEFGIYKTKHNFENSKALKERLDEVREEQKRLTKTKLAVDYTENWTVENSYTKGKKMINDAVKLALRAFNVEADLTIAKVSIRNYESSVKRIKTSFKLINNMNEIYHLSITERYLNLKLEELSLALEYEHMVAAEKEEQRIIRERIREEEKVLKEINEAKKKIKKEEDHFNKAIKKIQDAMKNAETDQVSVLEEKLKELEEKLADIEAQKESVNYRETNTRAGYVYVISNIGSFGENVYKIGVTRRLTPMDRIKELSSASVPFSFDVHAMIFSEDAPGLENALHKHFSDKRVNKINNRKEFFDVTLEEIESAVYENFDETVEFIYTAAASEYRETLALNNKKAA